MAEKSRKGLPWNTQLRLGEKLRETYQPFVDRFPLGLLGLARRLDASPPTGLTVEDSRRFREWTGPKGEAFDPPAVRVLVDAFELAWRDLTTLSPNPGSKILLARLLMNFIKEGQSNPRKMATQAVLMLITKPGDLQG